MRNDGSTAAPDTWSVYLAIANADATVAAATAKGSNVIVPAMPVGELGTMAVVTDPGNAAHRHVAARHAQGLRHRTTRSTRPAWFELHTRAYDASVAFYRDVFGWDTHTRERRARVPLHDARRGRRPARRHHGRARPSCRRTRPRRGRSTSVSTTPTRRCARSSSLGGTVIRARGGHAVRTVGGRPDPTGARVQAHFRRLRPFGTRGWPDAKERPHMTGTTSVDPAAAELGFEQYRRRADRVLLPNARLRHSRPTTRCRRRWCARGAASTGSRVGLRCVRGCTASRATCASTC